MHLTGDRTAPAGLRAITDVARSVVRNAELIRELSVREVRDRYVNHMLGVAWAVLAPLLQMGLYLYLFTVVFPARLAGDAQGLGALVWLLSGLVVWFFITDVLSRSVGIVVQSPALVQRVLFPVDILPAIAVCAALPNFIVGLALVTALALFTGAALSPGIALLPLALILLAGTVIGLGYLLAALGPFRRDLAEIVQFGSGVGLFLAPVLYLPDTVARLDPLLGTVLAANPFTHLLACFRDALVHGGMTAPWSWLGSALFAALSIGLGVPAFERVKAHFAEAL